jgi:hypothetical protein
VKEARKRREKKTFSFELFCAFVWQSKTFINFTMLCGGGAMFDKRKRIEWNDEKRIEDVGVRQNFGLVSSALFT